MSGRSAARTRVVVIGGGENCEHDVSLASARSVAAALDADRYDVTSLTIDTDGRWLDADLVALPGGAAQAMGRIAACDVVFPAVHGPRGEDGSLAALCELAGVPYVGSGVRAGALAMDKWVTKLIAKELGIRTAEAVVVTAGCAAATVDGLVPPMVVKPVAAGSSHGVSRVDAVEQLPAAVDAALQVDDRVLIEEFVRGREVDVAVLEWPNGSLLVGPPLEIATAADAVFDTGQKYDGTAEFRLPADLTRSEVASLTTAATQLFGALGCAGVARFDFFVTDTGLVLNEVNTMPGMTEQSQVPKMFAAVGLAYPDLLDVLVTSALASPSRPPRGGDVVRLPSQVATSG